VTRLVHGAAVVTAVTSVRTSAVMNGLLSISRDCVNDAPPDPSGDCLAFWIVLFHTSLCD
jgi:hypothetical protein